MSTSQEKKCEGSQLPEIKAKITKADKFRLVETKFREILEILDFDLTCPSRAKTPERIAKVFFKQIFGGVDPNHFPEIKALHEPTCSGELIVERDISFISFCEHHFVPIIGKATLGFVVNKKCLGLYCLHKIVHYFAARPQLQERLASDIALKLAELLECDDVAVTISATQCCTLLKNASNTSQSLTHHFRGRFQTDAVLTQIFYHETRA